ncbi:MAG: threonine synthase, partial [Oscillospiraceae bacterium]|nr:threonine synthase [Oscillospiraceae bacterium]
MLYQSTRDASLALTAAEAIARGLSRDGGLFVPAELPALPGGAIEALAAMPYRDRAVYVMKLFLDDFSEEELDGYAGQAYGGEKFSHAEIAPVRAYDENTHFLELWHGPTSAFKDMALQMLPHFLTASLEKTGETRDVCILVATSGDTGKAA